MRDMSYDEHLHKYFMFQIKADFEPVEYGVPADETLYRRVDYGFLACNCGDAIKVKMQPKTEADA